ncbi:MAG: hypothetical protein HUU22_07895 [Phycisphaerae bacterium]|nr:hypothetical protein [Phycisphaerae bacterium]
MIATSTERFKSGDSCPAAGSYGFDGFLEHSCTEAPASVREMEIWLFQGSRFPFIHGIRKCCFWKSLDRAPSGEDRFRRMPP